jgi:hypothetical protein
MQASLFAANSAAPMVLRDKKLRLSYLAACLVCATPLAFGQTVANPSIGRMLSAVGTVTLESKGGAPPLVGSDTELRVGDVVQTQAGSSAALRYIDGTNVQLGQRSRMTINEFVVNAEQPTEERFIARLFTGAMRVVTGLVAKRRPANVRFSTSTATVGIRGTDFVIRECDADCIVRETNSPISREVARASEELAGRMATAAAQVSAAPVAGAGRALLAKGPFRPGETLSTTTSAALFVLRDGTRIALDPNSTLVVRSFEFDEASAAAGRIALVLVRGKVQIIAGRIARARAEQMTLMIGSVLARPASTAEFGAALQTGSGSELVQVSVTTASVVLQSGASGATTTKVETGTTVTLQNGAAPVTGGSLDLQAAAPGTTAVDSAQLFGQSAAQPGATARPGTYVFVNDGAVMLGQGGQELSIAPGETGFANITRAPLELVANGTQIAGITALGLQMGSNDPICR